MHFVWQFQTHIQCSLITVSPVVATLFYHKTCFFTEKKRIIAWNHSTNFHHLLVFSCKFYGQHYLNLKAKVIGIIYCYCLYWIEEKKCDESLVLYHIRRKCFNRIKLYVDKHKRTYTNLDQRPTIFSFEFVSIVHFYGLLSQKFHDFAL